MAKNLVLQRITGSYITIFLLRINHLTISQPAVRCKYSSEISC